MPHLHIQNLSITFGGLRALSDFNFSLDIGQLVALIGPNGAGKTTAFNVATGVYTPTTGRITLDNQNITNLSPVAINHLGIARTFQNIRLFQSQSVLDNVLVALHRQATHGLLSTLTRSPRFHHERAQFHDHALQILQTLGLDSRASHPAASLPYGQQRRLEIARALATSPKILLLDEPAAGMNPAEKIELMQLIQLIRDKFSLGIWLIEHDMNLVMSISDQITVLDHGETIATGSPPQIQANPKVIEAYLGDSDASH